MSAVSKRSIRFVHRLLAGGEAGLDDDGLLRTTGADRAATLEKNEVAALIGAGVLSGTAELCFATPEASNWLRRQFAEADPFAVQHRQEVRGQGGRLLNLTDSPLARLAVAAAGESEAFLAPHQVEAGERLRRLIERAQLRQRVTMSYDENRTVRRGSGSTASEIGDLAADARRVLMAIGRALPRDCLDVVFDVCGLEKGLQLIEAERRWPRRSAKLVLRIGLEQLAQHFGLEPAAVGRNGGNRTWMEAEARPLMFPD